jgi:succinate-semialdehyde dehydrogenase / glutarate-semialdehyde dehydrogenase
MMRQTVRKGAPVAATAVSAPFDFTSDPKKYYTVSKIMEKPLNFINGAFVEAPADRVFQVVNPATHDSLGMIPKFGAKETNDAISAAETAFESWSTTLPRARAVILRRWHDLMIEYGDNLGAIITRESGKPIAEGHGESVYAARFLEWYANEAERIYGDIIPSPRHGVRTTVVKQPVGVVGVITPWNFPAAMIARAVGGAIAAGCTCVVKPSELTPFSALALAQLAQEAGLPKGVLNIVTGDAPAIGSALSSSFAVRKLSFTGSTKVGKQLMRECADTVKKLGMELGGNAPLIVFEDADIAKAVAGIMAAKFRNAGQTCVCANRVFVHESIFDKVVEGVVAQVRAFRVGYSLDPKVGNFGPLINPQAVDRVEALCNDAVKAGAKVLTGGKRGPPNGNFFEPTVLTNVTHDMSVCQSEIFGPLLPILSFKNEDDVVRLANSTRAGLASYVFTENYKRQWRLSEKLQFGMIGINDGIVSTPVAPFGGIKESGLGRDGSKYGIDAFVDIKYVLHSNL